MRLFILFLLVSSQLIAQSVDKLEIVPVPKVRMNDSTSYVYCASSVLMWKAFSDFLGENPRTDKRSKLIHELNRTLKEKAPLDSAFFVSGAGKVSDGVITYVNGELFRKFDKRWNPVYSESANPLLAYSYLQKNVLFRNPLVDVFTQESFGNKWTVDYFGIDLADPKMQRKDVIVHDFKSVDDFIVELKCRDTLDEIYLAKIPKGKTLISTYDQVIYRVEKGNKEFFTGSDVLKIPYLKLDTLVTSGEWSYIDIGKFENKKIESLDVAQANQSILFDMNEQGIRLESSFQIIMDFPSYDYEKTRLLAFDEAFLVVMKRRNSSAPYFLYWVNGAECMRTYTKKQRQLEVHEKSLVGRWQLDYSMRPDSTTHSYNFIVYIEYREDGTFVVNGPGNPTVEGTWYLSPDQKTLTKQFLADQLSGNQQVETIETINETYYVELGKGKTFYKRLSNE